MDNRSEESWHHDREPGRAAGTNEPQNAIADCTVSNVRLIWSASDGSASGPIASERQSPSGAAGAPHRSPGPIGTCKDAALLD